MTKCSNTLRSGVAKSEPSFIARVLGRSSETVTARAVGLLSSATRNCIYALDSSSNQAITENGVTMTMPKCGIVSNGGLLFNQGTIDAASIGYAGATKTVNNTVFTHASPKSAIPATDPCPTVSGCAYLKANPPVASSCSSQTTWQGNGNATLNPGTYCQQVLIGNNGTVTFNAGLYIFEQGMTFNSGPTSVTGTNVTFYVQNNTFIVDPSIPITLAAPTTGNYAGVLVYQPSSNNSQFHINSATSTQGWQGMRYAPSSTIIIDGALSNWLLVVADDITLNSGSRINDGNSAFPNYAHAVLAE